MLGIKRIFSQEIQHKPSNNNQYNLQAKEAQFNQTSVL
jgi:hypothetical protein